MYFILLFDIVNTFQKQVFHCNTKYLSTIQTIKKLKDRVLECCKHIYSRRCSIVLFKYLCASQTIASEFRNLRKSTNNSLVLRNSAPRGYSRSRFWDHCFNVFMYYANSIGCKVCHRFEVVSSQRRFNIQVDLVQRVTLVYLYHVNRCGHHKKLSIAKLDFVQVCGLSLSFYNNTLRKFYKFSDSWET